MNDAQEIRRKAAQWMVGRGWKARIAKRRGFEQSLFEHTDVELNALLTILPILSSPGHYDLSQAEQQALIVGQIAHDAGKEPEEWQDYVKREGAGPWVTHVIPTLTAEVVPDLVQTLGFSASIVPDASVFVDIHMKSRRSTGLMAIHLIQHDKSSRWATLASIVDVLDNVCSASGLLSTLTAIEQSILGRHLRLTYHLAQLRGVSTTLLHRATINSYMQMGWSPLLHFANGTIYIADSENELLDPDIRQIKQELMACLSDAMPDTYERFVVGSPIATLLPKPDLFDYRELPYYLQRAKRAIRRGSFLRKPVAARQRVVASYWKWLGNDGTPTEEDVAIASQRIDRAQPEMIIFKFFKEAVSRDLVCRDVVPLLETVQAALEAHLAHEISSGVSAEAAQARYLKAVGKAQDDRWKQLEEKVREAYDATFGDGAFAALRSTSTLMPAKDLAFTVDRYWALPGEGFGLGTRTVEDALDENRAIALIKVLDNIAQNFYLELEQRARPARAATDEMARSFICDLRRPSATPNIVEATKSHLAAYQLGKEGAKRPPKTVDKGGAALMCPICNDTFHGGTTGKADFLPKPESHTNRALAHGRAGNIVICDTCKYERFLQQMLLGEQATEVLVLLPHMNVGQITGNVIVEHAHRIQQEAVDLVSPSSGRLDQHLTLQLTYSVYNVIKELDAYRLSVDQLLSAITYTSRDDKLRASRKALEAALRELAGAPLDDDVTQLNEMTGEQFVSWEDAINQVETGRVSSEVLDTVIGDAFKLRPSFSVVCQTPNMILMPVTGSFTVGKDGEANTALRKLFIMLLIGLALDCTVDMIRPGDPILFNGGEGIARVPPIPAVRDLVGSEWIQLDKASLWLSAIGAAAMLAPATNYPARSNMYSILTAPSPGHILRRIEQAGEGNVAMWHVNLIDKVKEVFHA